ncbi:hypothetical protein SUGI_0362150 [Cryptomeria japonica]|nr:hypothetical protein SUGI_0362150 [Cryptomeria japonica]
MEVVIRDKNVESGRRAQITGSTKPVGNIPRFSTITELERTREGRVLHRGRLGPCACCKVEPHLHIFLSTLLNLKEIPLGDPNAGSPLRGPAILVIFTIMVETFLEDSLGVVIETAISSRRGQVTSFVRSPGVLMGIKKADALEKALGDYAPAVGPRDRKIDYPSMKLCKETIFTLD